MSIESEQPGLAITSDDVVPPLPDKSRFRRSGAFNSRSGLSPAYEEHVARSVSNETLPPRYAKYDYNAGAPVVYEGTEKAERIWANHKIARKGGWGRLIILLVVVACLAVALGVGLGLGLKRHKKSSATPAVSGGSSSPVVLGFPIGQYSFNTALRSVETNCTSNPSTWKCYPYSTYSASTPSTASFTTFNWIITNTSATYLSNSTLPPTSSTGLSTNLTISASNNPFSITFTNQSLTYLNTNAQPRYEFSFEMSKQVVPTTALTSDNSASTCFYNSTLLSATLYLSATTPQISYPNSSTAGPDSYEAWPYSLRVRQVAAGGGDVPACYKTVNGVVGERVSEGFLDQGGGEECICDYANFDLALSSA